MTAVAAGACAAVTVVVLARCYPPLTDRPLPGRATRGTRPSRGRISSRLARVSHLRAARTRDRRVADALPDAVDLLLLSTSAGLTLPIAHPLVAERVAQPLADALRAAHHEAALGRPRADALIDALAPLGDRALSVGYALADHLRYGAPIVPTLERLSGELRLDRRRRAEQDARRVPVRLLAPLIVCVLPAFALLTVVPLLAASLRQLPT